MSDQKPHETQPESDPAMPVSDDVGATNRAPETRTIPWHPVVGVAVVVAIYFASQALAVGVIAIIAALQGGSAARLEDWQSASTIAQFLYVLTVEVLTVGLLLLFMRLRRVGLRVIGLLRPRLRDLGTALMAYPVYFILNLVVIVVAAQLLNLDIDQEQQIGFDHVRSTLELALTYISLAVMPPIVEEIVMRGFLFGSLKKKLPVVRAAIITSVIFALAHLQFGSGAPLLWAAAIDTFILSLVLCYLRQRTGSLWAGIVLHWFKNSLAFFALFIAPRLHLW